MLDLNSLIKTMPRAYSYIRFSTPEQAKGDSLRRQMEMSAKYAEENGLVLDTSLKLFDQGLSGFNGENLDKGALGLFIRAVETGLVPRGSFLLVESIDRLSRNKLLEQVALFTTLISAGITVITLKDRQVLNREAIDKDNMLLFITMVGMLRANDESEVKSSRVRAAWAQKRKLAREKKLSAACPGWLKLNPDRKSFTVIPERVALIRRMFEMNASGTGQMTIARIFNQEKIPVWGRGTGWHMSFIQRILHTRAVLGEFQPCFLKKIKKGDGDPLEKELAEDETEKILSVPDGEPIPDYYPAIVDLETWQRVQRDIKPLAPGRKGKHVSNLFAGTVLDGYTGTSMRHLSRRAGRGEHRERYYYLVSDYARMGTGNQEKSTSWRYDWFEELFLNYIVRLDWSAVAQEAAPLEESQTRTRFAVQQEKLKELKRQLEHLGDLVSNPDQAAPRTILARIAKLEKEEAVAQDELIVIAKEAAAHESRRLAMMESGDKIKQLVKAGDYDSRLRLREEIRRKIDSIEVFSKGVPEALMEDLLLKAPGRPAFKIVFANKTERWVFLPSKKPGGEPAMLDTLLPEEIPDFADDEVVIDATTGFQIAHPTLPVFDAEKPSV